MGSRLPAPHTSYLYPGETDFRKINDAVNSVGEQAFAPFTEKVNGDPGNQAIADGNIVKIAGLEIEISVPVPSKAYISANVAGTATTYVAGEVLWTSIYQDGAAIADAWMPGLTYASGGWFANHSHTLVEDLVPETLYTFALWAQISPWTSSAVLLRRNFSKLIVRVEARQRI